MSANATTTLWQVTVESGTFGEFREGQYLFTNQRAAKSFVRRVERDIDDPDHTDITIEPVEAFKSGTAAAFRGWPFPELAR